MRRAAAAPVFLPPSSPLALALTLRPPPPPRRRARLRLPPRRRRLRVLLAVGATPPDPDPDAPMLFEYSAQPQPPAAPPPDVLPTSITPRVQATPRGQATAPPQPAPQQPPPHAPPPPVRLLHSPATPPPAAMRVLLHSPLLSQLRLPSRDRALVMAGELALILSVLLLLRAGVSSTLRWVHTRLNATRGLNTNIPYEASVFECMQRPLQFLSLFTVGTALAEAVSRPLAATGLVKHIMTLRELSIIFSATWFLLRWIHRIKLRFALDKRVDKAQIDATSRIATVAIVVVALLISLDTIGVNIQTVLAFGGIGGVAIGFAGREIISNFFGGFMIYITRPFSVGEWIRSIEERELNGTVEDIGWYLTRVRTWDKRPLYIPNSRFSTLIVENGSRMDNRRIVHTLHVRHEDMPVVLTIVAHIENVLMSHTELDPRQHRLAYVDSFDEFSVKIWFSCYTKSVFLYDYRRVQQELLVKCHQIIRAAGAKLATRNTRDVRPGVDTDRYGPLGANASLGALGGGALAVPDKHSSAAPENYDVPGALQYGQRNPSFNTIESGIDPTRYNRHVAPPAAVPAQSAAAQRDGVTSRRLSEAAMEASAAALLYAHRGAMRAKEEGDVGAGAGAGAGVGDGERDGPAGSAGEAGKEAGAAAAAAGQMKISRAPRRNEAVDGGAQGADGGGEGRAAAGAAAAAAGQMRISRAPPRVEAGDGAGGGAGGADDAKAQQAVAQMKISRAAAARGEGAEGAAAAGDGGGADARARAAAAAAAAKMKAKTGRAAGRRAAEERAGGGGGGGGGAAADAAEDGGDADAGAGVRTAAAAAAAEERGEGAERERVSEPRARGGGGGD